MRQKECNAAVQSYKYMKLLQNSLSWTLRCITKVKNTSENNLRILLYNDDSSLVAGAYKVLWPFYTLVENFLA